MDGYQTALKYEKKLFFERHFLFYYIYLFINFIKDNVSIKILLNTQRKGKKKRKRKKKSSNNYYKTVN